jgi:hypothetical protein
LITEPPMLKQVPTTILGAGVSSSTSTLWSPLQEKVA